MSAAATLYVLAALTPATGAALATALLSRWSISVLTDLTGSARRAAFATPRTCGNVAPL